MFTNVIISGFNCNGLYFIGEMLTMKREVLNVFVVAWLIVIYFVRTVGSCENFDFDKGKYNYANWIVTYDVARHVKHKVSGSRRSPIST